MASPQTTAAAEGLGNQALSAIPVVGPILSQLASSIENIFGSAHAAAVQNEAAELNTANPTFMTNVQAIVAALNADQLSPSDALTLLQQQETQWYSAVSSIEKGRWTYVGSQYPEPTYADSYANRSGPYGSSSANPDSHAPSTCNASCVLGHYFVERTIVGLTKVINAGGGSVTVETFPANGAIKGTPAFVLTYKVPSVLQKIEQTIFGVFAKL